MTDQTFGCSTNLITKWLLASGIRTTACDRKGVMSRVTVFKLIRTKNDRENCWGQSRRNCSLKKLKMSACDESLSFLPHFWKNWNSAASRQTSEILYYSLMFVLCFQGFDIASRSWITIFQIANFKMTLETWIAWHRKRLGLIIDSKLTDEILILLFCFFHGLIFR